MELEISFGKLVREHRLSLGLTQAELSIRVGCATITVRKIEADTLRPSVQIAERLAMALDVPLDDRANFVRLARTATLETPSPPPTPTPPPLPEEIGGEDLSGRSIRGYQLGERIGSGGFGAVYRATQPVLEREVAIKIILPEYANHPDFIRRFEAEAQLVARLEHPHIVPLYDYWREPDAAYLVMRLLRGGSLQALIKEGPMPLPTALRMLEQIGLALHAAHRFGVIHRDIKPANILLDEDENAYLADFGIAKNLGDPNMEDLTKVGMLIGSPAYVSPEQIRTELVKPQADIYCLGVLIYELLTGQLPFQGPTPIDFIQQHLTEPFPPLARYNPELPPALDPVILRATAKDSSERYPDVLNLLADIRDAATGALDAFASVTLLEGVTLEAGDLENPYKGLRAFGEGDAADFFGREVLIQELLGRMAEENDLARFLAVVGPSGSGKSSVVKAGLIPALRRGGLPGSDDWFVVDFLPGSNPLEELEAALLRVAVNPPASLLEQLEESDRGLLRAVRRILPPEENVELVLVIDQFEELFTLVEDDDIRAHFLESLVVAVMDPRSRLRVVITLRADFTDRPLGYVDFGELVRQRTEFVLPLTPDELELAIIGPARRVGVIPDPGLVNRIVHEVGDQPGTLPLLQYALTELFQRREGRRLTLAAYEDSGGVLGALGRRAEEIYTGLDEDGQSAARQLFLRLVSLGEGVEDTRRRVLRSELEALAGVTGVGDLERENGHRLSLLDPIIDQYGRYRLLTFDHDPITRGPTVEVAHEALLREWPRLRGWLNESRADVRMQRILGNAAVEWLAADRDSSFLLRGSRLAQFESWAAETNLALTQEEHAYLDASLLARQQREAAEAERQAREAALEQRSRRIMQVLVGVFAVATVVALILSGIAFNQRNIAERQTRLATSRELAAAAISNLDVDIERSILLAIQAVEETRSEGLGVLPDSVSALHQAVNMSRLLFTLSHGGSVAYSLDGTRLATCGDDNMVKVWDATTQDLLHTMIGHTDDVLDVAFSPDGTRLATTSIDRTARIWDPNTGKELLTLSGSDHALFRIAFSPDGTRLATTSFVDGTVIVWDAVTGKELFILEGHYSDVFDVAFSPDGKHLVTAGWDFTSKVWDSKTGQELFDLYTGEDWVTAVAFSPDGSRLATALQTFGVVIWDWDESLAARVGQQVQTMHNLSGFVESIAFNSNGTQLATGNSEGTLQVWNTESGRELMMQAAHTHSILGLAFSPDGKHLATSSSDGTTKVWDLTPEGSREWHTLSGYSPPQNLAFSQDGRLFAIASWYDARTTVLDAASGDELANISHPAPVFKIAFSPDGQRLGATHYDGTSGMWELNPEKDALFAQDLFLVRHSDAPLWGFAFSPDGAKFATSSDDGTVKIWDASDGRELLTLRGHSSYINAVAYNPDGKSLATAAYDGTAKIWDGFSGEELLTLVGHTRSGMADAPVLNDLAYSPDGKKLATASWDGTARIWDAATGELLLTLAGHSGWLMRLKFSPDGKSLATTSNDGTTRLWDAEIGDELCTLTGHTQAVFDVDFSPDGRFLVTSGWDGTVRFYLLPVNELVDLAKTRVTRWFTPAECLEYLHTDTCPPPPWEGQGLH